MRDSWNPLARLASARQVVGIGAANLVTCGFAALLLSRLSAEQTPIVLATLLLAVLLAPIIVAVGRGRFDLFEPVNIVMIFLAIQFPLQVYFDLSLGLANPHLFPADRRLSLLTLALLLTIAGALAFLAGYYLPRTAPDRVARILPPVRGGWITTRLRQIVLVFSLFGALAFFYFMELMGGLEFFIENMYRRTELARGKYYLLWTVQLLPLASLLWFTHLAARRYRSRGRWLFWVHLGVASAMTLALGGRGALLYIWEVMLVIHHYVVRPVKMRFVVVFGVLALAVLTSLGAYRQSTAPDVAPFSPSEVLTSHSFVSQTFQYDHSPLDIFLLLLERLPEGDVPLRWGGTFVDAVYQPIPRSIYPDKPPLLNTWYNQELLGAERGGKKASVLGDGFVNFHIPGIVALMFVYGLAARTIYAYLRANRHSPWAVLVYALLYKFIWSFSGGGFDEIAIDLLIHLIPILIALRFITVKMEKPARKAATATA